MAWLDWLKDVPISAAIKERLALKEEQFNELRGKNEELLKRIGVLEAENSDLKSKLKTQDESERFVDYKGVYWKKRLGGGFEMIPFCPSCTYVMAIQMAGYSCLRCKIETRIFEPHVKGIIAEITRLPQSEKG